MADEEYKTDLPKATLQKAIDELGEDPKQRAGQVQALKEWIQEQPHLKCNTDFNFLLRFLRIGKFSQLKARERLESYVGIFTDYPHWFHSIDTMTEPKVSAFLKSGYCILLPGRDKQGRIVLLQKLSCLDVKTKAYDHMSGMRAIMAMFFYLMSLEDAQIHGISMILDLTDFQMSHFTYWPHDDMKKITKIWQGRLPARFKGFNYYNIGPIFETVMAIFKPLLSKKFQERIKILGNNLEEVYKIVDLENLPNEYLPDDYEGPKAGTYKELADNMANLLMSPKVRNIIKKETTENGLENDKRLKDVEQASFRKLNVD